MPCSLGKVRELHKPGFSRSSATQVHQQGIHASAHCAYAAGRWQSTAALTGCGGSYAPGGPTGPRGRRGCSPAAAAENGDLELGRTLK